MSSRCVALRTAAVVVGVAAALLTSLLTAGCVTNVTGPVRTATTYEHKAAATAATASSNVATASLLARAGAEDRAMFPYLSVVISEAEDGLAAARSTFDAIQPPGQASGAVRDELDSLLDVAGDDVTEARIAIRRGDRAPLADLAQRLEQDAAALSDFEERYR
jgi:hypothetical protein